MMDKKEKIPKIIHYCWIGQNEMPERDKKNIEQWRILCPDYTFMFWNEQNYDITKNQYMREAYEKKKWGFVPDYLRLDIIFQYGGIYLDTDVEMCKRMDELLENSAFACFENKENVNLGSGFGAMPNNPIIKEMLNYYEDKHFVNPDGTLNSTPSPALQTEVLKRHGLCCDNKYQKLDGITIYPSEVLSPLDFTTGELKKTSKTVSIHWYNASWYDENERKTLERVRKINKRFGKCIGKRIIQGMNIYSTLRRFGMKGVVIKIKNKVLRKK